MTIETQTNVVHVSPKGVDVGKIEKELASMWAEVGDSEHGATSSGVTRACTLNLIVYMTPGEDRTQLDEMLDLVGERHPGRVISNSCCRPRKERSQARGLRLDAVPTWRNRASNSAPSRSLLKHLVS